MRGTLWCALIVGAVGIVDAIRALPLAGQLPVGPRVAILLPALGLLASAVGLARLPRASGRALLAAGLVAIAAAQVGLMAYFARNVASADFVRFSSATAWWAFVAGIALVLAGLVAVVWAVLPRRPVALGLAALLVVAALAQVVPVVPVVFHALSRQAYEVLALDALTALGLLTLAWVAAQPRLTATKRSLR